MAGYKPKQDGLIRDKTYPSEIAAQRPALVTRIHCEISWRDEREMREGTIRGDQGLELNAPYEESGPRQGDITESRCDEFNHALRSGHGFRNENDE